MHSNFDTTPRIFAFSPVLLSQAGTLTTAYGAELPECPLKADSVLVQCLAGGRDQEADPLILRALRLGDTAMPTSLADGRLSFCGYWSIAALDAIASGVIEAQEITEAEYQALLPPSTFP